MSDGEFLSLGAIGQVPGEDLKTVLDLTEQDFQDIFK
jgi:hypothetical protein